MIYCVEDEANIQELIIYALKTANFEACGCFDFVELNKKLEEKIPQMILLDIMLPGENGFEILKILKSKETTKDIPIILITAKANESDKIKGLNLGADDYITKPIAIMEMIARVKTVLRRCNTKISNDEDLIIYDNLTINEKKRTVKINGEYATLTYKEFELISLFIKNPGVVFTRDHLLNSIWGYEYYGESRTVDVHIRSLRQKLNDDGKIIKTVRNIGYKIGD